MSDEIDLGPATESVDEFLLSFCIENKFSALTATAIILARMLHLNKITGSADDYAKLLKSVFTGMEDKQFETPRNLH